jgi:hypothetical protein
MKVCTPCKVAVDFFKTVSPSFYVADKWGRVSRLPLIGRKEFLL